MGIEILMVKPAGDESRYVCLCPKRAQEKSDDQGGLHLFFVGQREYVEGVAAGWMMDVAAMVPGT